MIFLFLIHFKGLTLQPASLWAPEGPEDLLLLLSSALASAGSIRSLSASELKFKSKALKGPVDLEPFLPSGPGRAGLTRAESFPVSPAEQREGQVCPHLTGEPAFNE